MRPRIISLAIFVVFVALVSCAPSKVQPIYQVYFPLFVQHWNPAQINVKHGVVGATSCNEVTELRASWGYFYQPNMTLQCENYKYISMVWGEKEQAMANLANATTVLLYNEPDACPDQACIAPGRAAELAHELFVKYPGIQWISPAVSQRNPNWLIEFINAYVGQYGQFPPLRAIAVHSYCSVAMDCENYIASQITVARELGYRRIWLTEFAVLQGYDHTWDYTLAQEEELLTWLDNNPNVERYSWFMTHDDGTSMSQPNLTNLIDWKNDLTLLGQIYIQH